MEINNEKFIDKVNESGMTLKEISNGSGVSMRILSGLYNNKNNINMCTYPTLIAVADFFNCDLEDIINPSTRKSMLQG